MTDNSEGKNVKESKKPFEKIHTVHNNDSPPEDAKDIENAGKTEKKRDDPSNLTEPSASSHDEKPPTVEEDSNKSGIKEIL